MKVGVVGARRRRNGTGAFVARWLARHGARVVAVAGSSPASSQEAADALGAVAFSSVGEMLEHVDAVAICSPSEHHREHLEAALAAGVHVFCEKPLLLSDGDTVRDTQRLADAFAERGRVLYLNTQWVHTLSAFEQLHGAFSRPRRFEMGLGPSRPDAALFSESASHPVSLLLSLGARPDVGGGSAEWSADRLRLRFTVPGEGADIEAELDFRHCPEPPRPAWYAIDGRRIDRVLSPEYDIGFQSGDARVDIEDPLSSSVRQFLDEVAAGPSLERRRWLVDNARLFDGLSRLAGQPS